MIETIEKGRTKGAKDKKARKKRNLKSLIADAFRSKNPEEKKKEPKQKFSWESTTETKPTTGIYSIKSESMRRNK